MDTVYCPMHTTGERMIPVGSGGCRKDCEAAPTCEVLAKYDAGYYEPQPSADLSVHFRDMDDPYYYER